MKLLELLIQLLLIPSGKGHFPGAARTPQSCFSCWVLGSEAGESLHSHRCGVRPPPHPSIASNIKIHKFILLAAAGIENHSCAPNEAVFLGQSVVFCPNLPLNCLLLDKKPPRPQELGDKITSMLSYILTPFLNRFKGLLHLSAGKLGTPEEYISIDTYTYIHKYFLISLHLLISAFFLLWLFSSPNFNCFGSGKLRRLEGKNPQLSSMRLPWEIKGKGG